MKKPSRDPRSMSFPYKIKRRHYGSDPWQRLQGLQSWLSCSRERGSFPEVPGGFSGFHSSECSGVVELEESREKAQESGPREAGPREGREQLCRC